MKLKWKWDQYRAKDEGRDLNMIAVNEPNRKVVGWIEISKTGKTCMTMAGWHSGVHPLDKKRFTSIRKAMRTLRHAYIAFVISGGNQDEV